MLDEEKQFVLLKKSTNSNILWLWNSHLGFYSKMIHAIDNITY